MWCVKTYFKTLHCKRVKFNSFEWSAVQKRFLVENPKWPKAEQIAMDYSGCTDYSGLHWIGCTSGCTDCTKRRWKTWPLHSALKTLPRFSPKNCIAPPVPWNMLDIITLIIIIIVILILIITNIRWRDQWEKDKGREGRSVRSGEMFTRWCWSWSWSCWWRKRQRWQQNNIDDNKYSDDDADNLEID